MAVSFVVLYNCLIRGLIVQPASSFYEQKLVPGTEITGLELFSCIYGVDEILDTFKATSESNDNRRISFYPVNELETNEQERFEISNQLANGYTYQVPSVPADTNLLSGYPGGSPANGSPANGSPASDSPASGSPASGSPASDSPASDSQSLPPLHSAKRNCHIIKCPKFSQTTYGSDGGRCFEFRNPCFMAVASCKRHNNRLPRLKEISKKHCDKLMTNI